MRRNEASNDAAIYRALSSKSYGISDVIAPKSRENVMVKPLTAIARAEWRNYKAIYLLENNQRLIAAIEPANIILCRCLYCRKKSSWRRSSIA